MSETIAKPQITVHSVLLEGVEWPEEVYKILGQYFLRINHEAYLDDETLQLLESVHDVFKTGRWAVRRTEAGFNLFTHNDWDYSH